MLSTNEFRSIENCAFGLFPGHEPCSVSAFRRAQNRYFKELSKMDSITKTLYFNSTYSSKEGICQFMWNNHVYFMIAFNPGTIYKEIYYGIYNRNFITLKY